MSIKSDFLELAERFYLLSGGKGERRARRASEKPGEAFSRLPAETREQLKSLRSDDVKDVRWPPWDVPQTTKARKARAG